VQLFSGVAVFVTGMLLLWARTSSVGWSFMKRS
jgi:hypothetical protein